MGRIVLVHLMGHPHISINIPLIHYLPSQHLRHEGIRQHQEKQHRCDGIDNISIDAFHPLTFIVALKCFIVKVFYFTIY